MKYCVSNFMGSVFYKKDGEIYQIPLNTDGTFDTSEVGATITPDEVDERDAEEMAEVFKALN